MTTPSDEAFNQGYSVGTSIRQQQEELATRFHQSDRLLEAVAGQLRNRFNTKCGELDLSMDAVEDRLHGVDVQMLRLNEQLIATNQRLIEFNNLHSTFSMFNSVSIAAIACLLLYKAW